MGRSVQVPATIVDLLANRGLPPTIGREAVSFAMDFEIEALLTTEAKLQGSQIDSSDVMALQARAMRRSSDSARCESALKSFHELAASLGMNYSIFKGPALSRTIYNHASSRTFGDVDVLIGECDQDRLREFLTRMGRSPESSEALVNLNLNGTPIHEVQGSLGGADFDVHFNPFGLVTPMRAPGQTGMHALRNEVPLGTGVTFRSPSAELHLLIVLVNLCRRGGGALRFYADAARLSETEEFDWHEFWRLADSEGLSDIANQALLSLRFDIGIDIPTGDLPTRKRAWWGPSLGEPPNSQYLHRRAPLLSFRLRPNRHSDVVHLLRWYVPRKMQKLARFG